MPVVRLKKYDRRKGNVLRRYTVEGRRFNNNKWYNVSDDVADFVSTVLQHPDRPDRPGNSLAFDVCEDMDAAMRLIDAEKRRAKRAPAARRGKRDRGDMEEVDVEGAAQRRTEMAALERLEHDDEPEETVRRVHTPERGRTGPKPARKKAPAKAKAKPKAKPKAKAKAKKSKAAAEMPSDLDAATWADDDEPTDHQEIDPFE